MTKRVDRSRSGPRLAPLVLYIVLAVAFGVVLGVTSGWFDGLCAFLILVAFGGFLFLRTRSGDEAASLLYDVNGDERQRLIRRRASEQAGNITSLVSVVGWLVATALHQTGAATAFVIIAAVGGLTMIGTTVMLSRAG